MIRQIIIKGLLEEKIDAKILIRNPILACSKAIEAGLFSESEVCLIDKKNKTEEKIDGRTNNSRA